MIKIMDDIDLSILEQYGFKRNWMHYELVTNQHDMEITYRISMIDRVIRFSAIGYDIMVDTVIYNLIKDGLVTRFDDYYKLLRKEGEQNDRR